MTLNMILAIDLKHKLSVLLCNLIGLSHVYAGFMALEEVVMSRRWGGFLKMSE